MGLDSHAVSSCVFLNRLPELIPMWPECRFLLDTYGRELLSSGSGVLDIAGGKGELAFELVNLNNIRATVVNRAPSNLPSRNCGSRWTSLTACKIPVHFPQRVDGSK